MKPTTQSERPPLPRIAMVLLALLLPGPRATADEALRLPVVRDTWLSAYPTEVEGNNGAAAKLKLKGVQEVTLLDVDPAPLVGKRVVAATLHLHLQTPTPLSRVTVSTVVDEWAEGAGTGYARADGAASFAWARTGTARWGGDGPDVTAVSLGRRGSVWGFGDATPPDADGWQVIPVAPAVIEARAAGRGRGFLVVDDVGSEYDRDGERFVARPLEVTLDLLSRLDLDEQPSVQLRELRGPRLDGLLQDDVPLEHREGAVARVDRALDALHQRALHLVGALELQLELRDPIEQLRFALGVHGFAAPRAMPVSVWFTWSPLYCSP